MEWADDMPRGQTPRQFPGVRDRSAQSGANHTGRHRHHLVGSPSPLRHNAEVSISSDKPIVAFGALEFRPSAIQGTGAFARGPIPRGRRVIEYVGEKITKAESLRRCEQENYFIFNLGDEFDLDGDVGWNPAKFINHSCAPNCEAELCDGRIWIVALRRIKAGEEIVFNYSYDLEDYKEHPCRCGAADCVGYIVAEEFFPKFSDEAGPRMQKTEPGRPALV